MIVLIIIDEIKEITKNDKEKIKQGLLPIYFCETKKDGSIKIHDKPYIGLKRYSLRNECYMIYTESGWEKEIK